MSEDKRLDLPPPGNANFELRLRETLRVYLGVTGDPLDRGVTVRDLQALKLAQLAPGGGGAGSLLPSPKPQPPLGWDGDPGDLTPPPTPTGFALDAGITNVFVTHDPPQYLQGRGHDRTILYGVRRASAYDPLPAFSDAARLSDFMGEVYAYPSDPATTWHMWITWKSRNGVESPTPAGGANGLTVRTGEDVQRLLDALHGQITESALFKDLGERIDLVDKFGPGSVSARILGEAEERTAAIQAEAKARGAAIVQEATTRASAIEAEAAARQQLAAQVADNAAAISQEATARATKDEALSQSITALAARTDDNAAAIVQEVSARTTAIQAEAQARQQLATQVAGNAAAIAQETQARTTALAAEAAARQTLAAQTGNNTAAIQTESQVRAQQTGQLLAQYTVKVDVNGYAAGFGLASEATGAGPATSAFAVRADRFYVASPGNAGGAPQIPFTVQTTPVTINGVEVPVGVYLTDGFIKNGTITNAKIANAAIDDAKVANLSASKLRAGTIAVGEYIKSSNFVVGGTAGWRITGEGNAEFRQVEVRGGVFASYGQIAGIRIDGNGLCAGAYTGYAWPPSGTGLHLSPAGLLLGNANAGQYIQLTERGELYAPGLRIEGGNARLSGTLEAANGTFRGTLLAANGTFSGSLTATAVNAVDTINLAGNSVTSMAYGAGGRVGPFNRAGAPPPWNVSRPVHGWTYMCSVWVKRKAGGSGLVLTGGVSAYGVNDAESLNLFVIPAGAGAVGSGGYTVFHGCPTFVGISGFDAAPGGDTVTEYQLWVHAPVADDPVMVMSSYLVATGGHR